MIAVAIIFCGLVGLAIAAIRFDMRVRDARLRLGVLTGGLSEAEALAAARARLRVHQKRVQNAVDTGTVGVETAHRAVSGYFGHASSANTGRFYERVRGLNRGVGQTVAGWLATRKHRRSETLAQWRSRNDNDENDP